MLCAGLGEGRCIRSVTPKQEVHGLVKEELLWQILRRYQDLREGHWDLYDT